MVSPEFQVRRNLGRFPPDFMFQLSAEEAAVLRSQIATSKQGRGGRRYAPYAFTEHGAIMLANVLSTPRAAEVSVYVVRAFVRLREMPVSIIHSNHRWSCSQSAIRNPQSEMPFLPAHGPAGEIPAPDRVPGRGGAATLRCVPPSGAKTMTMTGTCEWPEHAAKVTGKRAPGVRGCHVPSHRQRRIRGGGRAGGRLPRMVRG